MIVRIFPAHKVSLCFQTCCAPRRCAFVDFECIAYLRLRDAGVMTHEMDKIELGRPDPLRLHLPDGKLGHLPGDFCDLSAALIHR